MKSSRLNECLDYIRFECLTEGFDVDDELLEQLTAVLEEDRSADEVIQDFIEAKGLDVPYTRPEDEGAYYEGTYTTINYFSIHDRQTLRSVANYIVAVRLAEQFISPTEGHWNFDHLKALHENIFSDIYPSAGTIRTVDITKRTQFCQPQYIESSAILIFNKLYESKYLKISDIDEFVNDFAYFMGELEALHPFRNGNACTNRFFFNMLTERAGYRIRWIEIEPDKLLEAHICAIDGDYQPLIDVISEVIETV